MAKVEFEKSQIWDTTSASRHFKICDFFEKSQI
jgi:hypothetical protein